MSKEYKNIDDLFRSELGQTPAVPGHVKKAIDKKLGFSRFKIFAWIGIFAAVALLTTWVLIETGEDQYHENVQADNLDESNLSNDALNNPIDATDSDIAEPLSNLPEANSSKDTESSSNQNKEQEETNFEREIQFENQTQSNGNTSALKTEQTQTATQPKIKENNNNKDFEDSKNPANETRNKDKEPNPKDLQDEPLTSENNNEVKTGERQGKEGNTLTPNNETAAENNTVQSEDKVQDGNNENTTLETESKEENSDSKNLASNSKIDSSDIETELLNTDQDSSSVIDTTEMPETEILTPTNEKENQWFLTASGGFNKDKSFYNSSNVEEEELYKSSTSNKIGSEFEFEAKYRVNSGLTFGLGLAYNKFVEQYDFFKTQSYLADSTMTTTYEYDSIQDTTGSWTVFVVDSNEVVTGYTYGDSTVYQATGNTQASYLIVPISFGVQIPIKEKLLIDLFAQGRFNYLVGASGGFIANNQFISFTTANSPFKRMFFDLTLGTRVHYNLFKNLYLTGTIKYKPVIGSMYQNVNFERKVHYTHFGLGLSLKL